MTKILIEVETTSPTSLRHGIELLEVLLEPLEEIDHFEDAVRLAEDEAGRRDEAVGDGVADPLDRPPLYPIIQALTDPDRYDRGRRGYMAMVAEAGDHGADCRAIIEHFGQRGSLAFGGTHSAIERAWRALKGTAWGPRLIWDSPDRKRQIMLPEARSFVLEQTSGWEAP
jgi:hypothetical protein